ncbi:hypothetical protein ACHAXT_001560 [Thalassiosira profunda]
MEGEGGSWRGRRRRLLRRPPALGTQKSMNSTNTTDSDSAAATPPVAEEDDMVASIPRSSSSSKGAASTTKLRKLSTVSRMYDIDGDGELDAAELAMRKMDSTGRGYLSNDKVYKIMQEQLETQKQLFRTRRVAFVLLALVVLLALSNLGTSFAAAHLAKDTTVTSTEALAHKQTGDTVGTQTTEESVEIERTTVDSAGRRRLCGKSDTGGVECTLDNSDLTLSKRDCKRMLKHCKRGNKVNGVRTWRTGDQTITNICPSTGQRNKFGVSVLRNDLGESFEMAEDSDGNCWISGDAFRQQQGFICDIDSDCAPGLSCAVRQNFVDQCKQRCEWKRWAPHKVGQCKTGCEHPSCQAADE